MSVEKQSLFSDRHLFGAAAAGDRAGEGRRCASRWTAGLPLAILVMLALGACALSGEGAIDYRKAEITTGKSREKAVEDRMSGHTKSPAAIKPVRLVRKDIAQPEAKISKNEKVSIRLRDGLLHDCSEFFASPLRRFKKKCEIAIVFKAFELGDGNDFNFGADEIRDGRVVYFSHDVAPGQFFNLHNMPVYGPLT